MLHAGDRSHALIACLMAAIALLLVAAPPAPSAAAAAAPAVSGFAACPPGKKCVSMARRTLPARRIGRFAFLLSTGKTIPARASRRAKPLAHLDALGPLLSDVGGALAEIADGDPEGVFLYVEKGKGWMTTSVFKDEGDVVRYLESEDSDLADRLVAAWRSAPEGKRWSVLEYAIHNGRFAVTLKYAEEVDVESFDAQRLEAALRKQFGTKPIRYPAPGADLETS